MPRGRSPFGATGFLPRSPPLPGPASFQGFLPPTPTPERDHYHLPTTATSQARTREMLQLWLILHSPRPDRSLVLTLPNQWLPACPRKKGRQWTVPAGGGGRTLSGSRGREYELPAESSDWPCPLWETFSHSEVDLVAVSPGD